MKRSKFFKIASATILGSAATIGLSSCSFGYQSNGVFTTYSSTNYLSDNNSPLNNAFNNSPISTYVQSALYYLTTYQTVGDFKFGNDGSTESTTSDYLTLEGAKALIVFKDEATATKVDSYLKLKDPNFDLTKNTTLSDSSYKEIIEELKTSINASSTEKANDTSSTLKEGTDYWVFRRDKGALQFQQNLSSEPISPASSGTTINTQSDYYKAAISSGTVYQFIVDTSNKWVDSSGQQQVAVSSKDFERSIEAYSLASDLNYNRNGYFLDLLGLDFDKTCGYTSTITDNNYKVNNSRDWTKFDIDNYANANDNIFTLYISTAYPYTLGLLSKEYFAAIPHTNEKVQNISLKSGYIKYTGTSASSYTIDQSNTDWTKIYGSGGLGYFTKDVWYASAYYIYAFTSSNIIFQLNNTYMDTVGKYLLNSDTGVASSNTTSTNKIKKVIVNYGSGTNDTYYELFKSKQNDFLSSVPSNKMSQAAELFRNNGLVVNKVVQTSQSNYIAYTPSAYVASSDGKISVNSYMGNMAQFIYQWNSKDSYIIRSAIAGLVNWYQLSLINLPTSGDFQLSATPYGVFSKYYENVSSGNLLGGLPRQYSDYTKSSSSTLSSFTVPYYNYSSNEVKVENLTIDQTSFQNALKSYGATTSSPLQFAIKFGEGSFSTNYTNFLNRMKQVVENLSGGLIKVTIMQRLSTNPTATEWYNKQSAPLGFSYWSPDYNGVGTWLEADTTLQSSTIGGKDVEGVPSTNAHNSYITFLSSMVSAVKVSQATWDSTNKEYKVAVNKNETNIFDSDYRIKKAFSEDTLKSIGVNLSSSSSSTLSSSSDKNMEDLAVEKEVTPGTRYALLGVSLVNKLIKNGVFDQSKFDEYVKNPSKLYYSSSAPKTVDELYVGHDVIKSGQSGSFSKWIGVFAGESTIKALYENTVLDSDYSYIPRSESGLSDKVYSLVNPNYVARVGTQSTNYRDFGWKNS